MADLYVVQIKGSRLPLVTTEYSAFEYARQRPDALASFVYGPLDTVADIARFLEAYELTIADKEDRGG